MEKEKPGYKTTEFWLLAVQLGAVLGQGVGLNTPPDKWVALAQAGIALGTGLYGLGRGIAKQVKEAAKPVVVTAAPVAPAVPPQNRL